MRIIVRRSVCEEVVGDPNLETDSGPEQSIIVPEQEEEAPPLTVDEELDRCARIAKRKYKVWPSAYASGAAVKCRKGKIWRGLKETLEDDQESFDEEIIENAIYEVLPNIKIISMKIIGSTSLSPEEKEKHDIEKYGRIRDDNERDVDVEVIASNVSNEEIEEWAFSEQASELESEFGYDVQIRMREIDEPLEEKKKRKYKPSFTSEKEQGLHGWFARNDGKGWVNCRTGGPCGRESADEGGKYPACRPTLAQCKSAGRGPLRKKKSSKNISWTNEGIEMKLENLILEEFRNVKLEMMSEGMRFHVETKTSLYNPIYRPGSKAFTTLMNEARELCEMGHPFSLEEKEMLEGSCGKYGIYEGNRVLLEVPMVEEELDEAEYHGREVPIGKPQRGGSKKFYVYVKDGDRVKKISFGDPNLSVKVGDPKRRASFVARHRCTEKNDRLTAGYWSCRIGRYPHLTGAKQRYTWW